MAISPASRYGYLARIAVWRSIAMLKSQTI